VSVRLEERTTAEAATSVRPAVLSGQTAAMTVVMTDPAVDLIAQTVLTARPEKVGLTVQKAETAAAAEVLTRTAVKVEIAQPAEARREAANAVLLATVMTVAANAVLVTAPLMAAVRTAVVPVGVIAARVVSEKKASLLTAQTVVQVLAAMTAEKEPAIEKAVALTVAMTAAAMLPVKTDRFLETETKTAPSAQPAEKATGPLTATPHVKTVAAKTAAPLSSAVMTALSVLTVQSALTARPETAKVSKKVVLAVQMRKPKRPRPIT
jgi:hypothetical protein